MQRSSTIDFWLGSKYGSWQYCQKKVFILKIFPQLCKTFCVFIPIMHALLCRNNQKNVFQEEIKDWALKPIYWLRKPVLDSRWLNHWKWLVSDLMHLVLEFLSNGGGLNCFSWHVLPKLSKIIETCPKSIKWTE